MKKIKLVFAVFLSIIILGSVYVYGENIGKSIHVTYRNISILVNGKIVPSEQEPFIYQGRTFVPLRTIGEAVNKTVEWDNAKNQIKISDPVSSVTRLGSYYELLNYFPDHYKYSKSDEKLTPSEISKIEEFWNIIKPKDAGKIEWEKYPPKSYRLKNNNEEMIVFSIYRIMCIRYKDGLLYFIGYLNNSFYICGSSDGWISKNEFRDNGQSDEDRLYLDYIKRIDLSILKDNPNRTKQITDLYAIPLWLDSLE